MEVELALASSRPGLPADLLPLEDWLLQGQKMYSYA